MKELYPILLDLTDRSCVVIGGGETALMHARNIDEAGGNLTIVAPDICREIIDEFSEFHEIRKKQYDTSDLEGAFIVFAVTDNIVLNSLVATDCRENEVLVYAQDQPAGSDFFAPQVIRIGGVHITVSTGGAAPALDEWLKREIERGLSYRLEEGLEIIMTVRRELMDSRPEDESTVTAGFREFFGSSLWRKYLDGDRDLTVGDITEWISSYGKCEDPPGTENGM